MKKNMVSQNKKIWDYLLSHGSITPKEALDEFGCMRLGARIFEIKESVELMLNGYSIVSSLETGTNRFGEPTRYAKYILIKGD